MQESMFTCRSINGKKMQKRNGRNNIHMLFIYINQPSKSFICSLNRQQKLLIWTICNSFNFFIGRNYFINKCKNNKRLVRLINKSMIKNMHDIFDGSILNTSIFIVLFSW